jgi:phosphatidylserine/phosphatidylglycerophosphate/cardiolipin synthase-like enzyme
MKNRKRNKKNEATSLAAIKKTLSEKQISQKNNSIQSQHTSNPTNTPSISVMVPFAYGEHIFRIIPARPWGHYEHFLLQIVAAKSQSAHQLAEKVNLPYQLVTEIMIPFMRIGWVVLVESDLQYLFTITPIGKIISEWDELPTTKDPQDRKRSFVIDPITENCYRIDYRKKSSHEPQKQPFQVFGIDKATKQLERHGNYATTLTIKPIKANPSDADIYNCIAQDGEEVISFYQRPFDEPYHMDVRFAIAEVDAHGQVSGMPEALSDELKCQIVIAAKRQREKIRLLNTGNEKNAISTMTYDASNYKRDRIFDSVYVPSGKYRFITGGNEHKEHLYDLIDNAQSKLIIHSTFIHPDQFENLLPSLLSAAARSVEIYIMWGQLMPKEGDDDQLQEYKKVIESLERFQRIFISEGFESRFKVHIDPSDSHAKFIICDHAIYGYCATFGSCNWLASNFHKFESSVCVADNHFVSDALRIASALAKGKFLMTNDLSQYLAHLSVSLKADYTASDSPDCATINILSTNDHELYLLKARDEAEDNIFVCSHRVSHIADNSILPTILSNQKARKTAAYGRATGKKGGMTNKQAEELKNEYETKGFNMVVANQPQIHAKILSWDSDNVVITSLNWLSASSNLESYREIGVYVKGSGVSDIINSAFQQEINRQNMD